MKRKFHVQFGGGQTEKQIMLLAGCLPYVVHHALCNVIEPAFEQSFIEHSYANRVGKGTHRALDQAQRWMARYPFVLQCDLRQFFPSIDHRILQRTLNRRIQDGDIRRLIAQILAGGEGVLDEEYKMVYFAGDDLFAQNRRRGLPIGNLTSQFWANCYLNAFDAFVTRELGCRAYLRYVDDFLLFADDKATLWRWKQHLIERLNRLRLTLHEQKAQVRPASEGIRFLGFVLYPDHRRLLRRRGIDYQRRLRRLLQGYRGTEIQRAAIDESVRGWINHVRYADTWGLRGAILRRVRL